MNKFDNNVLLSIYRKYSLNESIAYLKSIIEPLQTEIGMLKSEYEESLAKNKYINIQINELQRLNKQLKTENNILLKCSDVSVSLQTENY